MSPIEVQTSVDTVHVGAHLSRSTHLNNSTIAGSNDDNTEIEPAELGRHDSRTSKSRSTVLKQDPARNGAIESALASSERIIEAEKWMYHLQFATLCWNHLLAGWNDGTAGPLLPRIQQVYNVGFAIVSLIFVFSAIGFVSGAVANVFLTDKFGFGKVMVIGAVVQVIGYAIDSSAPPFPVLVLAYALSGFGMALQDAGANGFVVRYKQGAATKMSILHAVYGVGALAAPLVSTQFSQLPHWSFHFLVSLGIAISNTTLLIAVFRFKTQDEAFSAIGQQQTNSDQSAADQENKYKQIFRLRELHLLAFFILIYVGVEVTLGGWIVTYVINERGGGPSSGYISSGFFGGLTVGRIALLWVTKKVGQRLAIYLYVALAIALELIVWLVPSLIGGGIAVSFVGVLLGPVYPAVMNHSARILPPWLLTGCVGWIAGLGQAGSALIPFLTGAVASSKGIWSLQPLVVSMMAFTLVLWFFVPVHPQKTE